MEVIVGIIGVVSVALLIYYAVILVRGDKQ